MVFLPIPLIRKKRIIIKLLENNAVSIENAVTFREAGIINPDRFQMVTQRLIEQGILHQSGNKYYLDVTKL